MLMFISNLISINELIWQWLATKGNPDTCQIIATETDLACEFVIIQHVLTLWKYANVFICVSGMSVFTTIPSVICNYLIPFVLKDLSSPFCVQARGWQAKIAASALTISPSVYFQLLFQRTYFLQ